MMQLLTEVRLNNSYPRKMNRLHD